jgi:hypothetical protein
MIVVINMAGGVLQNVRTDSYDLGIIAIDWDEVKEGVYSSAKLRKWALEVEDVCDVTADDLRAAADEQDAAQAVTR